METVLKWFWGIHWPKNNGIDFNFSISTIVPIFNHNALGKNLVNIHLVVLALDLTTDTQTFSKNQFMGIQKWTFLITTDDCAIVIYSACNDIFKKLKILE